MADRYTRRQFLGAAAAGTLSFTTLDQTRDARGLSRRPLGSTGLTVTILGLGCAPLGYGRLSLAEGARIVEASIDGGITYIDCASSYRDAEEKVGVVMKERRREVVLATKVLERGRDDAWEEINRSIERLQTDHVDLLQLHAINTMSDLERILDDDGALRSVVRAKDEGLCTHIGITGHTRPQVIAAALQAFPFETVLCPLSSTDTMVNDFAPVILPLAEERGLGVVAMKVLAAGKMVDHPAESLRYSMTLPISSAIIGMVSVEEVQKNIDAAISYRPMTPGEMSDLEERTRKAATTDIMWWKRT